MRAHQSMGKLSERKLPRTGSLLGFAPHHHRLEHQRGEASACRADTSTQRCVYVDMCEHIPTGFSYVLRLACSIRLPEMNFAVRWGRVHCEGWHIGDTISICNFDIKILVVSKQRTGEGAPVKPAEPQAEGVVELYGDLRCTLLQYPCKAQRELLIISPSKLPCACNIIMTL